MYPTIYTSPAEGHQTLVSAITDVAMGYEDDWVREYLLPSSRHRIEDGGNSPADIIERIERARRDISAHGADGGCSRPTSTWTRATWHSLSAPNGTS